jgi:hypothetical protein
MASRDFGAAEFIFFLYVWMVFIFETKFLFLSFSPTWITSFS